MQGALFTTPVSLSYLALEDRWCNICFEAYIEPPPYGSAHEDQEGEFAVRVELIADTSGTKPCCGHIFGRRCLEAHLRSSGPWRKQCPLCRQPWFSEYERPVQGVQQGLPTRPPRRSERIARLRSSAASGESRNRSRSPQNESGQPHTLRHIPSQELARFTERLYRHLKMNEGSSEVGKTIEEVGKALEEFYGQRQSSED